MKIRMKSVTYAMKAKDMLLTKGITASVVRDLRLSGSGCVYAISFPDIYKETVFAMLSENKIAIHSTEKWDDLQ